MAAGQFTCSARTATRLVFLSPALGEAFKSITPKDLLEKTYARYLAKYGDKLGPTIDCGVAPTWWTDLTA